EQLRVKSEEAAELESIRAEKLRADQEVKRLTAALSAQGESSQAKIEGLRKQLEEAQGAARRAEKNASESEARFQAADRRAKELQDELVLVRKLNATLQSEADSAEELRAVLREIAGAVGASEEPSTLPQAVRGKVQELDAAQKLLAAVYKGLAGSDSLAVQLHETSPKEHPLDFTDLPRMVQDRIEEVEHLQSELARITQEKSEQEAKVLRLSANLDKATSQLKGLEVTEAALAKAQQELAALEKSAAATEERLNGEVRDLKREVRRQEELVKERQAVVEEVCAELTKAEEQRDRALEQRDAARKANVEKDQQIETLTREILSVEGELDRARRTLEDNTRHIRQMQAQIEEQSVGLSKRDQLIEDYRLRMEKAERSNKQLRAYIKETEQELEELKAEVEQLRRENRDLKKIIEQLAVILEVPFNPEEGTLGEQLLRRATALTKTERQLEEVMATHVKYEETIRRERERELLAVEEERLAREAEVERLALLAQQRERELESASSALTELQRQIQRAQDVGNALEEIGGEVGSEGVSLGLTRADADLVDVSRHHQDYLTIFPQLTKKEARLAAKSHKLGHDDALYLEALEKLREQYYGRHASFIRKQILEINAQPGKLNNLKLFTQFFGVTDQVSAITRTREFAQLKANRTMIERLQKQSGKEEQIARLTQENAVLTTALLRKTMQLIYRATDDSSGRSRFKNFGLHLMMWNDILNSLDASLYEEGDRRKALRSPDAELLRRTVGQLNVQFYRMMSMTHKQVQKGVWVAH
ncbi:MAG: hypothetical protein KDK64_07210, partial [Chlamydiia bacterium]|nr:hypothetical protein [Chlamydiia bacterium]